ncbi:MAG TPA: J domain-containing protein [Candidatus Binataceae bacterium]|nr:J domain-containing protein [Candidatus Binataceae bacterium]
MEFQDYYKTLGVERTASVKEIKSAYRKLARKHHPDVNPGNKDAEKRFKEINEAYQVLGDPEKRKKYDELGADWERGAAEEELRRRYAQQGAAGGFRAGPGAGGAGAEDFSDFFASFFGGGGLGGRSSRAGFGGFDVNDFTPREQKAPDLNAEVQITLAEAANGSKRRLELTAQDDCPVCKGAGMVMKEERMGQARVVRSAQPCTRCNGTGVIPNHRTLEVTIPAGSADGTRMRLAGQGGRGPRPELNGDLYLTVRIQPDRIFKLSGRDLRCELPVWDYEAALGAEVTAPTLDGRLSLKIPAASQTGRVMRLRGKGLPGRGKEPAGDLLYELKVLAPENLTDAERELLRDLADKQRERHVPDPRAGLLR